jgi:hypothetical protein
MELQSRFWVQSWKRVELRGFSDDSGPLSCKHVEGSGCLACGTTLRVVYSSAAAAAAELSSHQLGRMQWGAFSGSEEQLGNHRQVASLCGTSVRCCGVVSL